MNDKVEKYFQFTSQRTNLLYKELLEINKKGQQPKKNVAKVRSSSQKRKDK